MPPEPAHFVAWLEALQGRGPGENDPLFPWLAETATLEDMRWFLLQEVAGEAMAQVKMPIRPKLELARNYWDEMSRGREGGCTGVIGVASGRREGHERVAQRERAEESLMRASRDGRGRRGLRAGMPGRSIRP